METERPKKIVEYLTLITTLICLFFILVYIHAFLTSLNGPEVLFRYRLVRGLSASLAGFVLAVAGCFLQATLRNPLVDHYILGIGGGALFFTYISVLIFGYYSTLSVSFSAGIGGLVALLLTIYIAESISGSDVAYVLSGVSVTALFSGLSTLASYFAISKYRLAGVLLTGSFVIARADLLITMIVPIVMSITGYILFARRLNVMLLGDENAKQLGVNPEETRIAATIVAGVSSSIVVSLYGLIGFVGLISPHISRLILKTSDNRLVVLLSGLIGSALTFSTDLVSRYLISPIYGEIPAGVIVSVLGAPFFMYLLIKRLSGRSL